MARTATKAKSNKTLEASGDQRFFLCNGQVINSIYELPNCLKNMDDGTYSYHVSNGRNDFSSWISDVFLDKTLSAKVGKAKDKVSMATIIESYIS